MHEAAYPKLRLAAALSPALALLVLVSTVLDAGDKQPLMWFLAFTLGLPYAVAVLLAWRCWRSAWRCVAAGLVASALGYAALIALLVVFQRLA